MFCYFECYYSDEDKQNDSLAGNPGIAVMVHGALGSPGPVISNEQGQQEANIDVKKPMSSFGMLVGDVLHCFLSVCLCMCVCVCVCVCLYVCLCVYMYT